MQPTPGYGCAWEYSENHLLPKLINEGQHIIFHMSKKENNVSAIDLAEFDKLDREGRSGTEIAQHFGVSRARISQKRNELRQYRTQQILTTTDNPATQNALAIQQASKVLTFNSELYDRMVSLIGDTDITKEDLEFVKVLMALQRELRSQFEYYEKFIERSYGRQAFIAYKEKLLTLLKELAKDEPDIATQFLHRLKDI